MSSNPRIVRDDVDKFFEHGLDITSRTVYIGGSEIDHNCAENAIKSLFLLGKKDEPITVIINSPGGDEYHGLAIYDAIRACKGHVTIRGIGHVMSMGAWIMQAGDTREMTPHATMMIHYGEREQDGHTKNHIKWAEESERVSKLMEETFLVKIREKHPKFPKARLKEKINFDFFLTASQAVEMGLADKIVGGE